MTRHQLSRLGMAIAFVGLACCGRQPDASHDRRAHLPLDQRIATADPAQGAEVFVRCAACHNLSRAGGDRDGPDLWGVTGAPVGHNSPMFAYTAALQKVGGVWTDERLDRWLTNPQAFAPGTAMTFPGLSDPVERADVIAFLKRNGSPVLSSGAALRNAGAS